VGPHVEDIQAAADTSGRCTNKTKGKTASSASRSHQTVAHNTRSTIAWAEDLRDRCRRPNVMVKIPATKEGLPAIRDQISKGHTST